MENNLASPSSIFAANGLDYHTEMAKIAQDKLAMNEALNPSVKVNPVTDSLAKMSPLVAKDILANMTTEEIRGLIGLDGGVDIQ